jgi:transcription antitermination factor NusG
MHGLNAVITHVMPAKQRVKVLLNFLGRQVTVEVGKAAVIKGTSPRKELL